MEGKMPPPSMLQMMPIRGRVSLALPALPLAVALFLMLWHLIAAQSLQDLAVWLAPMVRPLIAFLPLPTELDSISPDYHLDLFRHISIIYCAIAVGVLSFPAMIAVAAVTWLPYTRTFPEFWRYKIRSGELKKFPVTRRVKVIWSIATALLITALMFWERLWEVFLFRNSDTLRSLGGTLWRIGIFSSMVNIGVFTCLFWLYQAISFRLEKGRGSEDAAQELAERE